MDWAIVHENIAIVQLSIESTIRHVIGQWQDSSNFLHFSLG